MSVVTGRHIVLGTRWNAKSLRWAGTSDVCVGVSQQSRAMPTVDAMICVDPWLNFVSDLRHQQSVRNVCGYG